MPRLPIPDRLPPILCLVLACTGARGGDGGLAIRISGGLTPEYHWVAGPGFSLGVVRVSAPASVVWGVADPGARLTPPIRHGATPRDTREVSAVESRLTAGVRYRVTITLADGRTDSREFTATTITTDSIP